MPRSDTGMALFAVLAAIAIVSAIGASLILAATSETAIAANVRVATEARFATDAALAASVAELRGAPDWTSIPGDTSMASFSEGSAAGPWTVADGTSIDVAAAVNIANCRKRTPCTAADMAAITVERPWGANNPQWRLFAVAYLGNLARDPVPERSCLVIAMVADDPADSDGDPLRDGVEPGGRLNPGRGTLVLRAEAFCTRRAHKILEATISRSGTGGDAVATGWVVSRRELN